MFLDNDPGIWMKSGVPVFWKEVAPHDHVVQVFANNEAFINCVEGFISSGFVAGENVLVIATLHHLNLLEDRLKKQGFDIISLIKTARYIPIDAEEALSKFFINEWPDKKLFNEFGTTLLSRAKNNNRKVRVFGELTALVWLKGYKAATIELEKLSNEFHKKNNFSLLCAYPDVDGTDEQYSLEDICSCHDKIINGGMESKDEVYYKEYI